MIHTFKLPKLVEPNKQLLLFLSKVMLDHPTSFEIDDLISDDFSDFQLKTIHSAHLVLFIGLLRKQTTVTFICLYPHKGNLQDLFFNENYAQWDFKLSLINDVIQVSLVTLL